MVPDQVLVSIKHLRMYRKLAISNPYAISFQKMHILSVVQFMLKKKSPTGLWSVFLFSVYSCAILLESSTRKLVGWYVSVNKYEVSVIILSTDANFIYRGISRMTKSFVATII